MQLPKALNVHGIRVLTTRQLAIMYGTEPEIINNNFTRNKTKYVLEKHYISVEGEEMKQLKTSHQFDGELKRVSRAYFWTEKGALLHAKSLNTDKAWQVYDYLVDFYFRAKEEKLSDAPTVPAKVETTPTGEDFLEIENPVRVFRELMEMAECRGIKVQSAPLKGYKSRLKGDRIAIRNTLSMNQVIFELAYELSHAILHEDGGNMLEKEDWVAYHMRARRGAFMLIEALSVKVVWEKKMS